MSAGPGASRIMGIDYGSRRVGVALSDRLGIAAHPFKVIEVGPGLHRRLADLVGSEDVDKVVVGLPVSLDGTEQAAARRTRRFVDRLRPLVGVDVVLYDERLTTRIAESVLVAAGTSRSKRRRRVDKVAAAVMLQGYLDRQARTRVE